MTREETRALLDRFLDPGRDVDAQLEELRDLICDLVELGDGFYRETKLLADHAPAGFVLGLNRLRDDWEAIGGQGAVDRFDSISREIHLTAGAVES